MGSGESEVAIRHDHAESIPYVFGCRACRSLQAARYQSVPVIVMAPVIAGGGQPCIWCNGPTQQSGTCYTCVSCGHSNSC